MWTVVFIWGNYCSRNQGQAMLHLHLPMCQHQLLHSLHILILILHPPTHHLLILLPPIHHILLLLLTIQLDHTHKWHLHPHTHLLPQLTHPIPHIHLPIHSTPTLHQLPIHPPPIPLHNPIRLFQLIHHLRIHRQQVILLVTIFLLLIHLHCLVTTFTLLCSFLFFSLITTNWIFIQGYTLHRHTDEDLLHSQPRKRHNVACTSLYNPIPALFVIRNPVFVLFRFLYFSFK